MISQLAEKNKSLEASNVGLQAVLKKLEGMDKQIKEVAENDKKAVTEQIQKLDGKITSLHDPLDLIKTHRANMSILESSNTALEILVKTLSTQVTLAAKQLIAKDKDIEKAYLLGAGL